MARYDRVREMELSLELDAELIGMLKTVELQAAKRLDGLRSLDAETLTSLHRQARISTIGATTRIENAVLTDAQIDWMDTELARDGKPTAFVEHRTAIKDKLRQDRERSLEEVAGCREMLGAIYDQPSELFPLTQASVRGLHHELLKYHPPADFHLGRYKVVSNSVIEHNALTGNERTVLKTSDPGLLTETAMADLLAWYNDTLPSSPWTLAVASEFVFRFLACHPFQDGNGRIGRGLFLLCLLQSPEPHFNQLAPYLAIDRAIEQRRPEYYAALARTGTEFNPDPSAYRLDVFLRFMLKVTAAAIDSVEFYIQRQLAIRALPQHALTVLTCFKEQPESRLTPKLIQEATGLPVRTVTRSLKRLVDIDLLQRYGKGPGTRYQLIF